MLKGGLHPSSSPVNPRKEATESARLPHTPLCFAIHVVLLLSPTPAVGQAVGTVNTIAGGNGSISYGSVDGIGTSAMFGNLHGVSMNAAGTFAVIAGCGDSVIRYYNFSTRMVSTLAGVAGFTGFVNGRGSAASFYNPNGVAMDAAGTFVLVGDENNHAVRHVDISSGVVSTLAGSASSGRADGVGLAATFNFPTGIAVVSSGTFALVADTYNNLLRRINVSSRAVTTLAGSGFPGTANGQGTSATFSAISGVAIGPSGTLALVTDYTGQLIRRIDLSTGVVSTLAGQAGVSGSNDGLGSLATFNCPHFIAIDATGSFALATDYGGHVIRRVNISSGAVSTISGTWGVSGYANGIGTNAKFYGPIGIALDGAGLVALVVCAGLQRLETTGYQHFSHLFVVLHIECRETLATISCAQLCLLFPLHPPPSRQHHR